LFEALKIQLDGEGLTTRVEERSAEKKQVRLFTSLRFLSINSNISPSQVSINSSISVGHVSINSNISIG